MSNNKMFAAKLEIMDWILADLRYVTGNQKSLKRVLRPWMKEHSTEVQEGEGIIVEGLSAKTRPRIVYCLGGKLWAISVPWDPDAKYSAYIAVSEFMRTHFKCLPFIQEALDDEIDNAKAAQKRAKKRKKGK